MDTTIFLFLAQDGVTSGAIYALLALGLVLVFMVTRILFIPQGEFIAFGALTYAVIETGRVPGTIWLLIGFGLAALAVELWSSRRRLRPARLVRELLLKLALPIAIAALVVLIVPARPGPLATALLSVLIIAPMGPYLYRFAFQPMADASILTLLVAAVGLHLALTGLGLVLFGAEGLRASPLSTARMTVGPLLMTGQTLAVYVLTLAGMSLLFLFFRRSIWGKALIATAANRLGARLVGIPTASAGQFAVGLAVTLGAVSGVLFAPLTTIYYDTGFLVGLKGFVAAILAGLVSFPGAALAAIGIGLVEAFASFYASAYKEIIVFMLVLPALFWRSLVSLHLDEEEE